MAVSCWTKIGAAAAAGLLLLFGAAPTNASYLVLHSFQGSSADGAHPTAPLLRGTGGNLYGTTAVGGLGGQGIVFKIDRNGVLRTLHAFGNAPDARQPVGGVIMGPGGDLYGTTQYGGASDQGAIFKVTQTRTETVQYSFAGGSDGASPQAGLIRDKDGNFYGTAEGGGTNGLGVVFQLSPGGAETVLHAFAGGSSDGSLPVASLIRDGVGNLYGTTTQGGSSNKGTVFKLAPNGTLTVLHSFTDAPDGATPVASLLRDNAGNLYGTARNGGTFGHGTIFKIARNGAETVLYSFQGGSDGAAPQSSLVKDSAGNFYGTTELGGSSSDCGTVFRLAPDLSESVLHTFAGGSDGSAPIAGLALDSSTNNLFGTTEGGCFQHGSLGNVFEITP